jgi:uncharacterized repeat protein (TIGR03803 family)
MKALFVALFAGMVGSASVQPASAAEAGTFKEKVLYSFCSQGSCGDGYHPNGGLIDVNGVLYGTTYGGGLCNALPGCGTVFSFDPAMGAEKVLYFFCTQQNCADGQSPVARLIHVKGILYGTTYYGGGQACEYGCGTVFSLDLGTGSETVLHSFCRKLNCSDGAYPSSGLKDVNGRLYGTTYRGGTGGRGTVFSIDPGTGKEKVLYSFCVQQNCTDGSDPQADLIDANGGILYGTTVSGGAYGYGTVFSVDPSTGAEKVLHSFRGADGQYPEAGLLDVHGTLYGTTLRGGAERCCGTVFSLDPGTGTEKVLYSFAGGMDGSQPMASLIDVNGTLYGTTFVGAGSQWGTVFSVDPGTGAESVLHSFCGDCTDGNRPSAGLIALNGKLYGETGRGGINCNCGTLFVLYPKKQ